MSISPKTSAAAIGAAATTLAVYCLREFVNIDLGPAEQGALTTLIVFACAYLKTDPARS